MNDTQTNELRDALESQRKEVLYDVSRHAAKGIGVGVIADETERADKIAENMVEHALSYSGSKLLEKIDHALERLACGVYGICESCNKEINVERLKAKPSVSLCIECQIKKESRVS